MNFLNIFEDRVAGIFGAAQAPFSFKKLAKQAAREMEDQTLVINGVNTAPALYTVLIAADDDQLLAPYYSQLAGEVTEFVRAQAEKKRYRFVGTPLVRFMIDPSLKPGKFSVFAENVDAPTLARLYEEERAYLKGASGKATPAPAPMPACVPSPAAGAVPVANPALDAAFSPASAQVAGAAEVADPFAPAPTPIPVPQTMTREQLAGMGGAAAATGAGIAAAGAAHMAPAKPSAPARPLAQLVDVVTGDTYELTSARATVGRERSVADVVLRDPNVSRRHAELTFTGSDWSIEDLNSTNGTMVNNRRITRCPLRNGDVLTFGLSTFEFRG
ncbi:FhaA domain-containing protein [Collinsella intestinalis]|uniref:DUF2662 domain-containing protein n=1 Tax=Collinsella intestinalis TaxID=147207 RepID=A0A414NEM0_9ACTN|nr:DUF3662 and FHA domain-containing protein [Collinsella intestinalis]RHF38254.1 DUF2662 domain-containing protein [Collinsella intestinalis]